MNGFLLSQYPVSSAFRARIEDDYGPLQAVTLAELRRMKPLALLRTLRGLRGTGVLAAETASALGTLPGLHAVAALTRAEHLYVAAGHGAPRTTARPGLVTAAATLSTATAKGAAALVRAHREIRRLLYEQRLARRARLSEGILHLNAAPWLGLTVGGSIAHTVGVANALADEGLAVRVRCFGDLAGLDSRVRFDRLLPPGGYALPPDGNRYRFAAAAVGQVAAGPPPGVIYERLALGSTAGAVLSRRLGVPLVVEYNGSEVWAAREWGARSPFSSLAASAEDATLAHAHLLVTVSERLREELVGRGVEPSRVVCHPNGVDADRFDPARFPMRDRSALRARYGIGAHDVLVAFVGTFGRWHGAEVLAEAAFRLAAQEQSIRFLFVGDGVRAADVAARVRGREDVIRLAGLVPAEDVPLHLAAADILVASHVPNPDGTAFFGSPTKLFEYMASGRAIVASDLEQIGEVVRDGAGELVEPGDPDALATAIRRLARDPELRDRLGSEARRRVLRSYTWRHHVGVVLDALDQVR